MKPEDRIAQWLADRYDFIEKIWLYGSRARCDNAERADIDLAIECPSASDAQWTELAVSINEEIAQELYSKLKEILLRMKELCKTIKDRL